MRKNTKIILAALGIVTLCLFIILIILSIQETKTKNTNFVALATEYDSYRNRSGDFTLLEKEREIASLRAYVAFLELRDLYVGCDKTCKKDIISHWQFKKLGEDLVDTGNVKKWLEENFFNSFPEPDGLSAFRIDLEHETLTYKNYLIKMGWIEPNK